MAAKKPSTTTNIPLRLESSLKLNPTEVKSEPLSLEMFNHAASDLDDKRLINLNCIVNI